MVPQVRGGDWPIRAARGPRCSVPRVAGGISRGRNGKGTTPASMSDSAESL